MADYFTHFSCLLAVGTPDNAAKAVALYQTLCNQNDEDGGGDVGFQLEVQPDADGASLWIHDDGNGDPDHVAAFVQRLAEELDLTGVFGFEWANACSRPRLEAFGGGAMFIDLASGDILTTISTNHWLTCQLVDGRQTHA